MTPVITFPDVVTLALPYLRTALNDISITVAAAVPTTRPAKLVTLRRAGGTERVNGILDRPRIDAQVWHTSEFLALQLADIVRAHLLAAPARVAGVSRASTFLGPTPIPDPESGTPRVLLTVEWQIKGVQS